LETRFFAKVLNPAIKVHKSEAGKIPIAILSEIEKVITEEAR